MEIMFASGNAHKRKEMAQLFLGHEILLPGERGIAFKVEEDGSSFLENAVKKAASLRPHWPGAILADDSGICVRALGGQPGIHSARYGSRDGEELEAGERNALLLEAMRGRVDRSCAFVCCMVLSLGAERLLAVQESMEGTLLEAPRGLGGFGYDPIVWLDRYRKSVAELSDMEKNEVSHRGRAASGILAMLAGVGGRA